jgi:hypothetical protein
MLRAFMESDREFKEWLRKHGPASSAAEAGTVLRTNGKEAVV